MRLARCTSKIEGKQDARPKGGPKLEFSVGEKGESDGAWVSWPRLVNNQFIVSINILYEHFFDVHQVTYEQDRMMIIRDFNDLRLHFF